MLISSKNVEIIKNYTKDIKDTTKTIRNVNDLNMAIRDFEHSAFEVQQENNSLKYELEIKDEEYRTTNINMAKYFNIMFAEAKLMESPLELQNQVALYLFNSIKLKCSLVFWCKTEYNVNILFIKEIFLEGVTLYDQCRTNLKIS